jgi:hypothetical protein
MINYDKESRRSLRLTNATINRFCIVNLNGQRCVYDKDGQYLYFWLQRGAYFSAGKVYKWSGSTAALGANRAILDQAKAHNLKIRVFLQNNFDRCYEADPEIWLEFAQKYKAVYWANEVPIHLLQWSPKYFRTERDDANFAVISALLQGGGSNG